MRISSYDFAEQIDFKENQINIVIIENSKMFRNFIDTIIEGINGYDIKYYLFKQGIEDIPMKDNVELIVDPFSLDFNSKKIQNKLNSLIAQNCEEFQDEFIKLNANLNHLAYKIVSNNDYPITFEEVEDTSRIIKMMNFSIDDEEMTFFEKILNYMRVCRDFLKIKLFVFVNLKSYISGEELKEFYKNIFYEKFDVLLLENTQNEERLPCEKIKIFDKDMCEIN